MNNVRLFTLLSSIFYLSASFAGGGGPPINGGGGGNKDSIYMHLPTYQDEFSQLDKSLMGEIIDLNSGSIGFKNTDLVAEGNGLDIVISRTWSGQALGLSYTNNMGDWLLNIPSVQTSLKGNYVNGIFTYSGAWGKGQACSGNINPINMTEPYKDSDGIKENTGYWRSDNLILANGDIEPLFETSEGDYKRKTQSNWRVSCLSLEDGTEGFIGYSPDGIKYTFDKLKIVRISKSQNTKYDIPFDAFMMVTEIEDRHGNKLVYDYDDTNLKSITASDGRRVTFEYMPDNTKRISSINYDGKKWQYSYDMDRTYYKQLSKVTRPDEKSWQYDFSDSTQFSYPINCNNIGTATREDKYLYVTHPDGSKGQFSFSFQPHGRSNLKQITVSQKTDTSSSTADLYTRTLCSLSIKEKLIEAAGAPLMSWTYLYSGNDGFWDTDSAGSGAKLNGELPSNIDAINYNWTQVKDQNGGTEKYYYNRDFSSPNEGKLVTKETRSPTDLLQAFQYSYQQDDTEFGKSGKYFDNLSSKDYRILENKQSIQMGSDNYTTQYSNFNDYGIAEIIHESNDFSNNEKYTKTSYQHDPNKWVINLPTKTYVSSNNSFGIPVSETIYNSSSLLPYQNKKLGNLISTQTYFSDGNLNKITYNDSNRYELFGDYYRGVPRKITFPCATSNGCSTANDSDSNTMVTLVTVNPDSTIDSVSDFKGNKTSYTYNPIGWLTGISYQDPSLADQTISYVTIASTGDGGQYSEVKAGQLKKTIKKGNLEDVTFYDTMLRPNFIVKRDITDDSTKVMQYFQYDHENRIVRETLPYSNASKISYIYNTFDTLNRTVKVERGSDRAITKFDFISDNRVQVTDPYSNITTTQYLGYGQPTKDDPTLISAPEQSTTNIEYNIFGNVTTISQGGFTENRVYDAYQNLCKKIRPETGATVFSYNGQGLPIWRAKSLSNSQSCDLSGVSESDKVNYVYTNLDQVQSETYSDDTPSKSYVYDENGNLTSLTAGEVQTQYTYNAMDKVLTEALNVNNKKFNLAWTYDGLGSVSSLTYPTGKKIDFAPNAFGQATKAGDYVTKAAYHPAGQVKELVYANGINRNTGINSLNQIISIVDSKDGESKLDYSLKYGTGDRFLELTDNVDPTNSIINVQYDGLDRLTAADGKWGASSYAYDSIGNITSRSISGSAIDYAYDANNRLSGITGAYKYNYQYDPRGNTTNNGRFDLSYNLTNQLVSANGQEYVYDGKGKRVKQTNAKGIKYTVYDHNGQLLYRESESGTGTISVYAGGQLVAESDGKNATYKHTDMLRTPVLETDSKGVVLTRSYYEPFGKRLGGQKEGIGYTGHLQDTDLGLTYMQARYYDPVIGRFYSNDPIGFRDIHSFNRYAYANNNPYKYVDPNGEWNVAGGVYGAISGASGGYNAAGESVSDKVLGIAVGGLTGGAVGGNFTNPSIAGAIASAAGQAAVSVLMAASEKGIENVEPSDIKIDGITVAVGAASAGVGPKVGASVAENTMKNVVREGLTDGGSPTTIGLAAGAVAEGYVNGTAERVVTELSK